MCKKTLAMLLALCLPLSRALAEDEKKLVALTFDDGPNSTTTNQVLDKLESYGVIASFFVIGDNINDESKAAMLRAHELGCEIGNHSRTHSDMTKLSLGAIQSEIAYTSDRVEGVIGVRPRFFRPPYISVNETMHRSIDLPFICGVGCSDWVETVSAEARAATILETISDGGIILMHDMAGNDKTVAALDILIPALLEQGYEFVTVSELFGRTGTEPVKGYIYTNVHQKNPW